MPAQLTHRTHAGNRLQVTAYGTGGEGRRPVILYAHGFKAFKDWGFVPWLGGQAAAAGMIFVAFNFSHNGIGEAPGELTELARFEQNTYSLEVSELREMIQFCRQQFSVRGLPPPLGLMGHSRGGGMALLAARRHPEVRAVATWGAISTVDRFVREDREAWRKRGYLEVRNTRTGQVLRVGSQLLDEVERYGRSSLHILEAVRELARPLLIVHGQQDETVPVFEAEQLNIFADPALTTLRIIPRGTHTFGAQHPFAGAPPALEEAIGLTLPFFAEHLLR